MNKAKFFSYFLFMLIVIELCSSFESELYIARAYEASLNPESLYGLFVGN
ncbi:MAG: hypothetical protein FWG30_03655 [Eubacteriaceae bacterium]|nr:hypothetical protein [Eubacteriaceae bacterium]